MRTRTIAGITVPALGSGDVDLTTSAARGVDARDVRAALSTTLELGLRLVDIHPDADSELLAGEVIRALRMRDSVVAAVRVPPVPARPGFTPRDTLLDRLPPPYVQDRVEAALRATKLDVLPLVHLALRPSWRSSPAWPELVELCARLVREGKVLAWGAFVDAIADDTRHLFAERWLTTLSAPFNPCERAAEPLLDPDAAPPEPPPPPPSDLDLLLAASAKIPGAGMLPPELLLAAATVPILGAPPPPPRSAPDEPPPPAPAATPHLPVLLARRPLAGGAYAGHIAPGMRLPRTDDRHAIDDATLTRIAVEIARLAPLVHDTPPAARSVEAAQAVLERGRRPDHLEAHTVGELALRYVLDRGAVPLPRLHRADHVASALACLAAAPLSADLVAKITDT